VHTRIFNGAGLVVSRIATLSLISMSQATIQAGTQNASYVLTLDDLLVTGWYAAYLVGEIALGWGRANKGPGTTFVENSGNASLKCGIVCSGYPF
jgi:hypothetical protein